MFDKTKLQEILEEYKKSFAGDHWEREKYKWIAVKHFQDNWDIDAEDFVSMLSKSLSITYTKNLLLAKNYFPATMIKNFAEVAPEETRKMFKDLFNEKESIVTRVENFEKEAERIRAEYGKGAWQSHYQNPSSISVYLWLRYPDKYYIYKYSIIKSVSEAIEAKYIPIRGAKADSLPVFIAFYNEIADYAKSNNELVTIVKNCLTNECYSDPFFRTLAIDIGYYIFRYYGNVDYAWFVGAYQDNLDNKDLTDVFVSEGRWESFYDEKFTDKVYKVKSGDKIVIKSTYTKKNVPFNANGNNISTLGIKAVGTVTNNPGDGHNLSVDWDKSFEKKEWFQFCIPRDTIALIKSSDGEMQKSLLEFIFNDVPQDYSLIEEKYDSVKYWPSFEEYPINISKEEWKQYILEVEITSHRDCMGMLKAIMELGGEATCKKLSEVYGGHPTKYVSCAVNIGRRAKKYFNLPPCIDKECGDVERFFPVPFLGRLIYEGNTSYYSYKIRQELYEALSEIDLDDIEVFAMNEQALVKGGFNKIYYGAPGCGKSRYVKDMLKLSQTPESNIVRVTFHPEYANCDFAGQILPTIEKNENGNDVVKYVFNPGPFTLALQTAYNSSQMVYLVIEEINRGNAAAIFGDLFQLLDREKDENDPCYSASEYPICNVNMQKYLIDNTYSETIKERLQDGVYIPGNLTILATMNSSDQNVFTLDTAFKRRWDFEQISNNIANDLNHKYKNWFIPGTDVTWETFLLKINDEILNNKIQTQTNEDKRLGKYFVGKECLTEDALPVSDPDAQGKAKRFAYKVLEYIWNDVCKIGREDWFDTEKYKSLEDLIEGFTSFELENPLEVFQNIVFEC